MWIFRDGKQDVSSRELVEQLGGQIRAASAGDRDDVLDALIRSGELESALADHGSLAASKVAKLTDMLGEAYLLNHRPCPETAKLTDELLASELPWQITISPPEGFAYYALLPSDFAAGLASLPSVCRHVGVIGIRSIGTTLSALATADLRRRGAKTDRMTVRPAGHPFERTTTLNAAQKAWVAEFRQHGACFLIVDEGPGMSGSSFLSVAEALESEGVSNQRIFLAGSRDPDLSTLRAPNAAARWQRFRWQCVTAQVREKYRNHVYLSTDLWRARHFAGDEWPACWSQMERLKFLSRDGATLHKFEGLGRFGREARERAGRAAELGFGCRAENAGDGMAAYEYLDGRLSRPSDLCSDVIRRIAKYCACRREFTAERPVRQQLHEMLAFNLDQEFSAVPAIDLEPLICDRPIVADGQMHPHEWMRDKNGLVLKLDLATHGDDHFFPGPTDIAWDLAGAIIEWRMAPDAISVLISDYSRLSGDDPRQRMPAYLLAYSVFRMSYCKMAVEAENGSAEAERLKNAYRFYRGIVERRLAAAAALHFSGRLASEHTERNEIHVRAPLQGAASRSR